VKNGRSPHLLTGLEVEGAGPLRVGDELGDHHARLVSGDGERVERVNAWMEGEV